MKIKIPVFILCLFLVQSGLQAQASGKYAFPFLEQGMSARSVALGSNVVAIDDGDISLALLNPSLIGRSMDNALSLSYINFFAGANFGMAQYGKSFNRIGDYVASLQFMDYGTFDYADPNGNRSGTFKAADYAFTLGWGRQLNNYFSIGASAKVLYSHYESYKSFGIAVDVAASYKSESGLLISLVASHIGTQFTSFTGQTSPLPFDMQLAMSKRLEHVPFRFSLVYDHIEKWDLSYYDEANPPGGFDPITGAPIERTGFSKISDILLRHFIVGGEIYIGKNIILRAGYNYRRRQEMAISQRRGMVGLSYGIGIRVFHLNINYARASYHLAGSPNYFTITTSLDDFMR